MKIYDCFIFNDELDLLELRLNFLDTAVDHFVLVESERTLSGSPKTLYYEQNKERFSGFQHKIIHVIAPSNDMDPWQYEFFQRNWIKKGLDQCSDDDIIFISDADEIINIKEIISFPGLQLPVLIGLPMYYYFLNVKTNSNFFVNIAANWSFLKDKDIGYRYKDYPLLTSNRITTKEVLTGWHFSYLFGYDMGKYQEKIRSFSHQEFNTPYYLDAERIKRCISLLIDIFERSFIRLTMSKDHEPLLPFVKGSGLSNLLYDPSAVNKLSPSNILFTLHKKHYRRMKNRIQQLFIKKKETDPGH